MYKAVIIDLDEITGDSGTFYDQGLSGLLGMLQRKNYLLAAISSAEEDFLIPALKNMNIDFYFHEIIGCDQEKNRYEKRQLLLEALYRLGMEKDPEKAVLIAGRPETVKCARNAGIETVALSYDFDQKEELKKADPLIIVGSASSAGKFFARTPLRQQGWAYRIFRIIYPAGIHFGIQQAVVLMAALLGKVIYGDSESLLTDTIFLTALAAALTMVPAGMIYRDDRQARQTGRMIPVPSSCILNPAEVVLLLTGGAALSMLGNILLAFVEELFAPGGFYDSVGEAMAGQNILLMIIMVGVLAPVAEEMIFRWLIYLRIRDMGPGYITAALISGILFGIYHGNAGQAIYASVLGFFFAWILELSGCLWSSALLHIGANVWSIVLMQAGEMLTDANDYFRFFYISLVILSVLMVVMILWAVYKGKSRGYRAV